MKRQILIASGIWLCFCLFSCEPDRDSRFNSDHSQAYVPVYMSLEERNNITISGARTTENSGKIYAFGNYIFQNDVNKGIHIIDNSDRKNPKKIAFLEIPFNTDFAVRDNYIYANNVNDLVVVDVHDINHPVVVKRMENAFPYVDSQYPQQPGYFVCPDPSKGVVVAWELQNDISANCRR
jgi:hypothetical protein